MELRKTPLHHGHLSTRNQRLVRAARSDCNCRTTTANPLIISTYDLPRTCTLVQISDTVLHRGRKRVDTEPSPQTRAEDLEKALRAAHGGAHPTEEGSEESSTSEYRTSS